MQPAEAGLRAGAGVLRRSPEPCFSKTGWGWGQLGSRWRYRRGSLQGAGVSSRWYEWPGGWRQ